MSYDPTRCLYVKNVFIYDTLRLSCLIYLDGVKGQLMSFLEGFLAKTMGMILRTVLRIVRKRTTSVVPKDYLLIENSACVMWGMVRLYI